MQFLTSLVMGIINVLKDAGVFLLTSAETVAAAVVAVLTSWGFWSVGLVAVTVVGVIAFLVKTDRLLWLA